MTGKLERARLLLAECLGASPAEIPDDARLGNPAGWDSLAHVRVVRAVEVARGSPLSTDEMLGLATLRDLEALL